MYFPTKQYMALLYKIMILFIVSDVGDQSTSVHNNNNMPISFIKTLSIHNNLVAVIYYMMTFIGQFGVHKMDGQVHPNLCHVADPLAFIIRLPSPIYYTHPVASNLPQIKIFFTR